MIQDVCLGHLLRDKFKLGSLGSPHALLGWIFASLESTGGSHLWDHLAEAGHDVCAFGFLIISKDASEDDNQGQDYSEVELINKRQSG